MLLLGILNEFSSITAGGNENNQYCQLVQGNRGELRALLGLFSRSFVMASSHGAGPPDESQPSEQRASGPG